MTSTRAPPTSVFWESTSKDWLGNYLKIDKSFHNQVKHENCEHKRKCPVSTTHPHLWLSGLVVHSNTAFHSSEESAITRKPVFKPRSCPAPPVAAWRDTCELWRRVCPAGNCFLNLNPAVTVHWPLVSLTPCVQLLSQVMTTGRVNCNRWRAEIFKICMFSAQLCKESQNPGKLQKKLQTICPFWLILCNLHPKHKHRGKETELRWTCTCACTPTSGSGYTSAAPYYWL